MDKPQFPKDLRLKEPEDAIKEYQAYRKDLVGLISQRISKLAFGDANAGLYESIKTNIGYDRYAFSNISAHYKTYYIRQGKRHKKRIIQEPSPELMQIQKKAIPYFETYPLLDCCMARKERGIRHNASVHENANYVLRVDISKCYPSIRQMHIWYALSLLESQESPEWHLALTDLSHMGMIHDEKQIWCLPTGSPLSPILCNIALTPIDFAVQKLAKQYGYTYTRYMDDLHLSTTKDTRDWELINTIEKIIIDYGLTVNKNKSRWYTVGPNDKVIITGVRIQQGCKVPRDFSRMVRAKLQNLAKQNMPIDPETQGCLAYISSIDKKKYESLLQYYQRRLDYVPADRERTDTQ